MPVNIIKKLIEKVKGLFCKKEEEDYVRVCALCEFCSEAPDENGENIKYVCEKRGEVEEDFVCRKFKYDLLKREPMEKRELPKLEFVSLDDEEEKEEPNEEVKNENEPGKEI